MANELATTNGQAIAPQNYTGPGFDMIPVEAIVRQTEAVKTLMQNGMSEGMHYGRIPGCGDKPTLLQPGAQKLTLMFNMADTYDIQQVDLANGHREYTVTCHLVSKSTGLMQGSGVGLCTTMEKKYRYRNVADFEITDEPIPQDARERKQEYRRQGYGMKKVDGAWYWVKYKDSGQQENPDIADTYNTVLKMACKRALVAACLNTLAVSDLFTQDIEDLGRYAIDYQAQPQQQYQQQPPRTQQAHQPQQPPQRSPRLNALRSLMSEAKNVGIIVSDPKDRNAGLMGWIHVTYGCEPDELGDAQIAECEAYVRARIADKQAMQAQYAETDAAQDYGEAYDGGLADHDISF